MWRKKLLQRPLYKDLIIEINNSNYSKLGKKYGVSGNCIKKWFKFYEKH